MPQNPLDFLQTAFGRQTQPKVPPPTVMQEENRDFRAQALQDLEPTWKKVGRGALDAITGLFEDPMVDTSSVQKGITRRSPGTAIGMLTAAAPGLPKSLPMITPEAYKDVKAGGLRLYSRLTDAFGKAPKQMHPQKVRDVARQGASAEEINYRKLEDFLAGRDPNQKVAREDIMGHLSQNPIELDVVRKGGDTRTVGNAVDDSADVETQLNQLTHELDTRYGNNWVTPQQEAGGVTGRPVITPEEAQRYIELENRNSTHDYRSGDNSRTHWESLQTPGPKENYSETLINLPHQEKWMRNAAEGRTGIIQELENRGIPTHLQESDGTTFTSREAPNPEWEATYDDWKNSTFTSSHWDEPNNLVFSRANDRFLNPGPHEYIDDNLGPVTDYNGKQKGKFVEEIQSDWHQQGRERGYRTPEIEQQFNDAEADVVRIRNARLGATGLDINTWADARREAIDYADGLGSARSHMVPDAPYKDTYHELALKQQLLDAANDPQAEWFGIADADTNAAMEGHQTVMDGTRLWYDEKQPSALERLLKPFGGEVKRSNLPSTGPMVNVGPSIYPDNSRPGTQSIFAANPNKSSHMEKIQVATSLSPDLEAAKVLAREIEGRAMPGPGMWKASLTPEMKKAIAERGFPAMVALMALQSQRDKMNSGQE